MLTTILVVVVAVWVASGLAVLIMFTRKGEVHDGSPDHCADCMTLYADDDQEVQRHIDIYLESRPDALFDPETTDA